MILSATGWGGIVALGLPVPDAIATIAGAVADMTPHRQILAGVCVACISVGVSIRHNITQHHQARSYVLHETTGNGGAH